MPARPPVLVLLVTSLLLAGCGGSGGAPAASGDATDDPSPADPGWRWESYAGAEVQVPEEWVGPTSGVAGYPAWCADGEEGPSSAGVNRGALQVVPAVACTGDRPAGSYARGVELGSHLPVGRTELAGGWSVEVVEVGGVTVAVTSDDPGLAQRVLASARPVRAGVDVHGCALDSGLRQEGARPPAGRLPDRDEVVAVSACRYLVPGAASGTDLPAPLLASVRWHGADAVGLVDALAAAPPGRGPDDDASCAPSYRLGDELVVLQVDTATDVQQVVVRYSGCGGHGVDDGGTVRRLTGDLLQQLLVGPLAPSGLSGVVADLLR